MTTSESLPNASSRADQLIRLMTVLSGIGSFGTLLLSLSGSLINLGESLVIFQGFAFGTILFAAILYYELIRNKWPGREDHYLEADLIAGSIDPNHIPEEFIRIDIVTLEKRERLAISEGKQVLAEKYREKIQYWEDILRQRANH
jgi:hypothetical protein